MLDVRVQPGASLDEVAGVYGNRLKVRIAARPVDNLANIRVTAFFAKTFGVPKARVRLVSGQSRHDKRVAVEQPKRLPEWLADGDK